MNPAILAMLMMLIFNHETKARPPHEYKADVTAFNLARQHYKELPKPADENMEPAR